MLAPVVAAIWVVPWFVTQDGLTHLYNASIIAASTAGDPAFQPLLRGPLEAAAELGGAPGADRAAPRVLALGGRPDRDERRRCLGFAVGDGLARGRGSSAGAASFAACALAALLGLSFSWLMGFSQLPARAPACSRSRWGSGGRAATTSARAGWPALSALLVLGYFGHLVSLGLTVCALLFLAIVLPTEGRSRWSRLWRTGLCMVAAGGARGDVSSALAAGRADGAEVPAPAEFLSVSGWVGRLGWVDPISVAIKDGLPFTDRDRAGVRGVLAGRLAGAGRALGPGDGLAARVGADGPPSAGPGRRWRRSWCSAACSAPTRSGRGTAITFPSASRCSAWSPWFRRSTSDGRRGRGAGRPGRSWRRVGASDGRRLGLRARLADGRWRRWSPIGPSVGRGQRVATLLTDVRDPVPRQRCCCTPTAGWGSPRTRSSGATTRRGTITSRCSSGPSWSAARLVRAGADRASGAARRRPGAVGAAAGDVSRRDRPGDRLGDRPGARRDHRAVVRAWSTGGRSAGVSASRRPVGSGPRESE